MDNSFSILNCQLSIPLVNVYIPTYKPNPAHLHAALDSLLAQTFADWTALVHDDASGTDVRSIVEPYLKDPRILFKESSKRLGIGGNWNACLAHGKAPFVQYLFQDDWWESAYLQRSVDVLTHNQNVAFTAAHHAYAIENGTIDAYEPVIAARNALAPGAHEGRKFLMEWIGQSLHPNVIGEPSFVMMRRESTEKAGPFLEDMPQSLDLEYWTRLLLLGNWYFFNENLGSFRVHASGASAQNQESGAGMYDRLRCFESIIRQLPGDDKNTAIAARNKALDGMVAKFFARMKEGKKVTVGGSGGGQLTAFCVKHPVLVIGAVARYMMG